MILANLIISDTILDPSILVAACSPTSNLWLSAKAKRDSIVAGTPSELIESQT